MQVNSTLDYTLGRFCHEIKNRFLCEVEINGRIKECYVPSSCRLGNFLELEGKPVLLKRNQNEKSRTDYSLFAFPYKSNYILLNPSLANKIVEAGLNNRRFSYLGKRKKVLSEHIIEGYKADLFIQDTETIVEIKSVISLEQYALFPTVFSERALEQLKKIQIWLRNGKNACYVILSLNPYSKGVLLNNTTIFYNELIDCIEEGLIVKAYTCRFDMGKSFHISGEIPVMFQKT